MKLTMLLLCVLFLTPLSVQASSDYDGEDILNRQIGILELGEINTVLVSSGYTEDFDFKGMLLKSARGELNLSLQEIINAVLRQLMNELFLHTKLMRNLILVCILSAILRNLSASFKQKSIGELGFFASYIVIVIILFDSFSVGVSLLQDTIGLLVSIMQASVPVVTTLLAASGNVPQALTLKPIIFFVITAVSSVLKDFLAPLLIAAASLEIVNYLTERQILTKLSELIRKAIGWGLKLSALLFTSTLSLQSITSKGFNQAVNKTAKAAVNLVPVVGSTLTSAVDAVFYWSQALKGGVLVTVAILILIACFIPFIKLTAMILIYKLTAAIIQPICDERITECIDVIGTFAALMAGILATIVFMFIFAVMIMLS